MAVKLSPFGPKPQFFDSNGDPLSGGFLYFYAAGSSTPQDTYTTSAGSTANDNPITLNSRGESANQIWFTEDSTYKAVLKTSAGVEIWSSDNLSGINDTSVAQDEWTGGTTPTYISATSFSVTGDQSSTYHVGRRLKSTNTAGTIYSTITAVAYSTVTTVTVVNDSGSLDSGLSVVSYGLLSANFPALSPDAIFKKATAVAAAASTNIWATSGDYLHITGSASITNFGTAPYAGARRKVIFDSTPVIAHDGTAISIPGTSTITAVANDRAEIVADTTTQMIVAGYVRPSVSPLAAADSISGPIEIAIQSEMEAGTDVLRAVTPGRQHFHPGHPKFWVRATANSTTIQESYNVTSVADTATGQMTVTIATDFAGATWCCIPGVEANSTTTGSYAVTSDNGTIAAGTVVLESWLCIPSGGGANNALTDPTSWHACGFGDHA
jgi:hypothetical protein